MQHSSSSFSSSIARIMPLVLIGMLGLFTCFVVACIGGPGPLGEGESADGVCSGYTRGYGYGYGYGSGYSRGYDENGNPCP